MGQSTWEEFPGDHPAVQPPCGHGWVRVSWDDLVHMCRSLADQIPGEGRPEVVVALARAGYVPGAILACMFRCDLLTLRAPPTRAPGGPVAGQPGPGSLGDRLIGRRVLIVDETTRTGESLAWAASVARQAGAAGVRTAVLFCPSQGPRTDYWGAITDAHLLQPWVRDCV